MAKIQTSQIEMQSINNTNPDKEEDFKNMIGILTEKIQLKRVDQNVVNRLDRLDIYYDLLPFNVQGFRLINAANLLEGNFIQKYIIKQTMDLNLDLDKNFQNHYFIKAAVQIADGIANWAFFVSLFMFTSFLLMLILDSWLYNLLTLTYSVVDGLRNQDNTTNPQQVKTHDLNEEILAIWFLYILIPLRLVVWSIDIVVRYIGLRYFRKTYITLTMLFDFILAVVTIMIVGFGTRLDVSLSYATAQTQTELIIRNMIMFILFLVGMVQSKKAMDSTKRLCLLFCQKEPDFFSFKSF